jgi:hypothetical protein
VLAASLDARREALSERIAGMLLRAPVAAA